MKKTGKGAKYDFTGKFDTFESCYEDKKMIWNKGGRTITDEQTLNILKTLEVNLKCQGICKPTLFWMYRDVTLGPPQQGCIHSLVDSFDKTAGLVAFGLAGTALVGIVLLIFSFGLYC